MRTSSEEKVQGWTFWRGTIDGYPVVVSKTLKGLANAAAATAIAAERYRPVAIINQGTAGGHEPGLHVFDIVVGTESVNLGSFKTGFRARGAGSNLAEWAPLDLMRSDGSAGNDPTARNMRRFRGDEALLAAARTARGTYQKGRVVEGVIGSSEIWNSEIDRIERFHSEFGTTAEEMETAAAAQIAGLFQIPFLGIRVVSNNITNGGDLRRKERRGLPGIRRRRREGVCRGEAEVARNGVSRHGARGLSSRAAFGLALHRSLRRLPSARKYFSARIPGRKK